MTIDFVILPFRLCPWVSQLTHVTLCETTRVALGSLLLSKAQDREQHDTAEQQARILHVT
jgi:hypothetical protein